MPTVRLTDAAIRKAIQQARDSRTRVELVDTATTGLRLRVAPDGKTAWSLKMRDPTGAGRRFTLGDYPTLGVAEARGQAAVTRHHVRHEGADPVAEKRSARKKALGPAPVVMFLSAVLDEYERVRKPGSRTWPAYRRRIELVFKQQLDRPAAEIALADLQRTANGYRSLGTAAKGVAYLRPVLKWAIKSGYVQNETVLIEEPRPTEQRQRVLSNEELQAIVPVLLGRPGPNGRTVAYGMHRAALLLILWTASRLNEVCRATWSEFDLGAGQPTWTVPVDHLKDTRSAGAKTRRAPQPHVIPLSHQAADFMRHHREAAGAAPDPRALAFPSLGGRLLGNWDRVAKVVFDVTGTSGWTRHDLRRTAATAMGKLGVPPHVVEAVLNHADIHSHLASTYNRSRYDPEQADALQRWANLLENVVGG